VSDVSSLSSSPEPHRGLLSGVDARLNGPGAWNVRAENVKSISINNLAASCTQQSAALRRGISIGSVLARRRQTGAVGRSLRRSLF
jgi:hypothetical protein